MSAGRNWIKEYYVGFLLLALSFLYLSHLNSEYRRAELEDELSRLQHAGLAESGKVSPPFTPKPMVVL